MRRVTVFFLPTTVVVFFTTSVSWRSPQRSTCAVAPGTVFVTVVLAGTVACMSLLCSEGEAFDVDVAARNAGAADVALDRARHRRRAAEKDLALGDVGHELAEMVRREQPVAAGRGVVAGDVMKLGPAP